MTASVTPSHYDAGNIDYEAHEVEGQPGTFIIFERRETREGHLQAPRMRELVPQPLELMDGTVEDKDPLPATVPPGAVGRPGARRSGAGHPGTHAASAAVPA